MLHETGERSGPYDADLRGLVFRGVVRLVRGGGVRRGVVGVLVKIFHGRRPCGFRLVEG